MAITSAIKTIRRAHVTGRSAHPPSADINFVPGNHFAHEAGHLRSTLSIRKVATREHRCQE